MSIFSSFIYCWKAIFEKMEKMYNFVPSEFSSLIKFALITSILQSFDGLRFLYMQWGKYF